MRILFVDFSTAFNTIIPDTLQNKLTQLSVPTSICQWINSFLTDRQQVMRLGKYTSSTRTISTGAPQGCVLSTLLFSLYKNDCTSKNPSVKLLKFADNTTLIDLIQDDDESAYRQEVMEQAVWCSLNNLELNMLKTWTSGEPTPLFFFLSNLHMSGLTHNCLYCILCFRNFVHCLFVYLYIVLLLSVSCPVCHSVALWSFCHYNKSLSV